MLTDMKTIPLGELASFEMGQSPDSLSVNDVGEGIPFLQGCAEFGLIIPYHNFYSSKPRKLCESNDILISVRAPVGTLNKADRVYCIGRGLAAIRFNNTTLPEFGWHLLNYWVSNFRKVAQGSTFEAIGKAEITNLRVSYFPDTFEQRRIAEILDTVDETIALTTSVIAKLKQIRAGLLHDLLTRGLDEDGKLRDAIAHPEQFKDSPLGRIPKDWQVTTIGEQASISSGTTPNRSNSQYWQYGTIAWIKTGEVNYTFIEDAEEKITQKALDETSLKIYPIHTVLMAMYGQGVTRGKVAILGIEATTNQACAAIFPNSNNLISGYLFQYLSYYYEDIRSLGQGSHQSNLNEKLIAGFSILLPPIQEQTQIVEIVNSYDTRIHKEEAYLDKLKLQKKGLMHDLLTGKVRVNQI